MRRSIAALALAGWAAAGAVAAAAVPHTLSATIRSARIQASGPVSVEAGVVDGASGHGAAVLRLRADSPGTPGPGGTPVGLATATFRVFYDDGSLSGTIRLTVTGAGPGSTLAGTGRITGGTGRLAGATGTVRARGARGIGPTVIRLRGTLEG
jgi:hypothetical protein